MTQALTKNLDTMTNTMLAADKQIPSYAADSNNTFSDNFNKLLNKTKEKQNYTLGDIKDNGLFGDMSEKIANFKEILIQATREVNMEKSLDLTLARDITEIISQLKNAIHPASEETAEELLLADDSSDITSEVDEENVSNSEVTAIPIFEQILTFINNAETNNINSIQDEISNTETQKQLNDTLLTKLTKPTKEVLTEKDSLNSELELDKDMLKELNIESISSETDFNGEDFMQKQESPEEYSVKVMLNNQSDKFEINFEKPINTSTSVKSSDYSAENIMEQITKHFDSLKSNSKINIVLNPESLGKVNLQILSSKDGLSAQFTVTTNDARELLMKGLDGLKEALLTHGVNIDNISVKISEAEEAYNPDWTEQENSEGENKEQQRQQQEEKEKGLFEKTIAEQLKFKNGSV